MYIVRKTRRIRKHLSKSFLGEGFFGKTYKAGHGPRKNAFSNILTTKKINKITLYKEKGQHVLSKSNEIQSFVDFLYNSKVYIVKIFKDRFYYTGVTIKGEFDTELRISRNILKQYGSNADNFLTITPVKGFNNIRFLGSKIETDDEVLYAVYSVICNNKYNFHFKRLLKDIAESIQVLQDSGYQHNDIKLDNIVLCNGKYKLIDWGQAAKLNLFSIGDMICTSPMKWYLKGAPGFISSHLMDWREQVVDKKFEQSYIFKDINTRINNEFDAIINKGLSHDVLFSKYKKTFDIFMLGMTLVHGVYKFSLNYETYKPIIYALTSLENPISDPKEAIKLLNSI